MGASANSVAHDLGDRPVGDALTVREAAAPEDSHVRAEPADELLHEPRLAHACGAEHREQVTGSICDRVGEGRDQRPELSLAPHERGVEAKRASGCSRQDLDKSERVHPHSVLRRARSGRLEPDVVTHEPGCHLADQDLFRLGDLLQPLGDVDRFAGGEQMAFGPIACDDFATVDAGTGGDADAPDPFDLFVENNEPVPHLRRRPQSPECVVLADDRDSEDSHDRVTDVLLDRAAMS